MPVSPWRSLYRTMVAVKLSHLRAICILIVAGYLAAGLWPLNFSPKNNTRWRSRGNGLRLGWQSIAYTGGEIDLGNAGAPPAQPGTLSLELWLTPEGSSHSQIRSILSLYDGNLPENLMLAEWRSSLLIRAVFWNPIGLRRYREVGMKGVLFEGDRCFITMTSGPEGTALYLDGMPARTYPKLLLRPDALRGRLLLGSSSGGRNKWNGSLHGLAAFNRTLDAAEVLRHYRIWTGPRPQEMESETGLSALYFFNEGRGATVEDHSGAQHPLVIPGRYQVLRKTVLHPPWKEEHLDFEDITVNVLGFIPFGFFYFLYRTRLRPGHGLRAAALTVLVAAIISMFIELSQVFLPMRDSSLTDWICNAAGALIGVIFAQLGRIKAMTNDE